MKIKQFQIDAFTGRVFGGNPAAVCPLKSWPEDNLLQCIAEENNLSETAFFVPAENNFELRWFTPIKEVDLCGHATLAAAHVILEQIGYSADYIVFKTKSGNLTVRKNGNMLEMDFPLYMPKLSVMPNYLAEGLGKTPVTVLEAQDYIAVYDNEETIRSIIPDQTLLNRLGLRGVSVTAPGDNADFVSRFFAPKFGIPEDPVTGSAHCELAPYRADRLNKNILKAVQVSKRGGEILCRVEKEKGRVIISGRAATFMEGGDLSAAVKGGYCFSILNPIFPDLFFRRGH